MKKLHKQQINDNYLLDPMGGITQSDESHKTKQYKSISISDMLSEQDDDSNVIDQQYKDDQIKNKIIEYLGQGDWKSIMRLIKDRKFTNLNVEIDNGNNLFHIVCEKGQTDIIKKILSLKKDHTITLNTNLLNGDGIPGIHLYYKYGGTDTSFFDYDEICYIDSSSKMLAIYLINKIDLLEILIKKTLKRGCINNTEIPEDNYIYSKLIKKIIYYSKSDNDTSIRYLNILKSIWLELKSRNLVFVAIQMNSIDVIKMLMDDGFNFMIYSNDHITPLSMSIDNGHIEIAIMILEYTKQKFGNHDVYKLIHASERYFNCRPIFKAIVHNEWAIIKIMIQYMSPYLEKYYQTQRAHIYFTNEIDDGHNTYLHRVLTSKQIINVPIPIIQFFIEHTDLNQENYTGVTSAHILVGKGLWRLYKDLLTEKKINLLKVDNMGNNCYFYIAEKDKTEFMEFSQKIKIPIDIKDSYDIQKMFNTDLIRSMINTSDQTYLINASHNHGNTNNYRIDSIQYGLFNNDVMHYMLYLRYLENKYKSIYVPVRNFSEKNKEREMFFFDLLAYNTSANQQIINKHVKIDMNIMYSYMPHMIYWINEDQNYINHDLIKILKSHDQSVNVMTQRYVMLMITIIWNNTTLHANSLIYDRLNKEAWRFEPYGVTNITTINTFSIDDDLHTLLEEVYGKITYHDPGDYLHGLNFQMVDGEDHIGNRNLGDPDGYCLAWNIWFIEVVISHPDKNVRDIMKNFFNPHSISQILSEEEGLYTKINSENHYLDFIRRYAHKLDNEKNNILLNLGVKKYYIYNTVMKDDVMDKIIQMIKINPDLNTDDIDVSDQFQ